MNSNLEKLFNIIVDLSAEAVVSIDEGETLKAIEQLSMLQSYADKFMEDNKLRQVTEEDVDYEKYMSEAYTTTPNKE